MPQGNNYIYPKFSTGIAKSSGESLFPSLWHKLIGYWSPELGGQSSKLFDMSKYRRHTTPNVLTAAIPDKFGPLLSFNGSSSYWYTDNIYEMTSASQDMSFVFAVRTTSAGNDTLFAFDNDFSYDANDIVVFKPSSINIRGLGDTFPASYNDTGIAINDGRLHIMAIVLQGLTLTLYKDGAPVWSKTVARGHGDYTSRNFKIGYGTTLLTGSFGLFATYNRALTPAEVMIYATGGSPLTEYFYPYGYVFSPDLTVSVDTLTSVSSIESSILNISTSFDASALETENSIIEPATVGSSIFIYPSELSSVSSIETPTVSISVTVNVDTLISVSSVESITFPGLNVLRNAVKIISFNPLVVITSETPLKIAKIDVSTPETPITTVYEITGAVGASDVIYDETFGLIYVACNDGKLVEIDATDFSVYTIYDTTFDNNLLRLALLPGYQQVYASALNDAGEIILFDNSVKTIIVTDVRWSALVKKSVSLMVDSIQARMMELDARWSALTSTFVPIDVRFNKYANDEYVEPITRLDFHVFIDNVEATDVKMDAITIFHQEEERSKATFVLARQYDNLDYTLENVYSQITNNNIIRIEINGNIEFTGKIWEIDSNSESETVNVTAYGDSVFSSTKKGQALLSLPTLNEKLTRNHVIVHNPKIENPAFNGSDKNPPFYRGIYVPAGKKEVANISHWESFGNSVTIAADVIAGNFAPRQNHTYFWFASAVNFITGERWDSLAYLGTSPSVLTSDTWNVTGMSYKYQRVYEPTITETPAIHLGTSPYKEISAKNDILEAGYLWEDLPDGLYSHYPESYDYTPYARRVAQLEYNKLQMKKTSANMELLIDGYYYHGIKLLTNINIDNTKTPNIFNKRNGYPLMVKAIEISSSLMKVTLTCDNVKTVADLERIENSMPDEADYVEAERYVLQYSKFDPRTQSEVD